MATIVRLYNLSTFFAAAVCGCLSFLAPCSAQADPQGKNINVWRLIIIGGFFGDLSELTYAGKETVNGTDYQVLEHKMIGTVQGKECPFDQKVYVGPDNLIHRFTLSLTLDGKPGSEVAELTNIKTGQDMTPASFEFTLPPGSQEKSTTL